MHRKLHTKEWHDYIWSMLYEMIQMFWSINYFLGVLGGSIAAGIQSAVYGGPTTGVFSALQSAGAVGISAAAQAGIGSAAGATAGLAKWKFFS